MKTRKEITDIDKEIVVGAVLCCKTSPFPDISYKVAAVDAAEHDRLYCHIYDKAYCTGRCCIPYTDLSKYMLVEDTESMPEIIAGNISGGPGPKATDTAEYIPFNKFSPEISNLYNLLVAPKAAEYDVHRITGIAGMFVTITNDQSCEDNPVEFKELMEYWVSVDSKSEKFPAGSVLGKRLSVTDKELVGEGILRSGKANVEVQKFPKKDFIAWTEKDAMAIRNTCSIKRRKDIDDDRYSVYEIVKVTPEVCKLSLLSTTSINDILVAYEDLLSDWYIYDPRGSVFREGAPCGNPATVLAHNTPDPVTVSPTENNAAPRAKLMDTDMGMVMPANPAEELHRAFRDGFITKHSALYIKLYVKLLEAAKEGSRYITLDIQRDLEITAGGGIYEALAKMALLFPGLKCDAEAPCKNSLTPVIEVDLCEEQP